MALKPNVGHGALSWQNAGAAKATALVFVAARKGHSAEPLTLNQTSILTPFWPPPAPGPLVADDNGDYVDVTRNIQRFSCEDPALLAHLATHGYAVVRGVAGRNELSRARQLLWAFLRQAAGWRRGAPWTWTDDSLARIGQVHFGIVDGGGVGQSNLSWYVRTLPGVRCAFERIWGARELLTSYDGIAVFRPWHRGFARTTGGFWHVDQGARRRGLHAVQGFVSLLDQHAQTGGLLVSPGSHLHHEHALAQAGWPQGDFVRLPNAGAIGARLVSCLAGDLVLLDSRCAHCGSPALQRPQGPVEALLRAVVFVCMTPRIWSTAAVREERREAYEACATTTHWPHSSLTRTGAQWPCQRLQLAFAGHDRRALIG